jgi:Uma2 family endonuclease
MSPSPTAAHQTIAMRLGVALEAECPDEYDVTQGVEVRINRRRSFIPDVLVTTATAAARRTAKYEPHEVVLAVEIVSDGSQAMDRITKPALYAQAGIPYYWRIETTGGGLTVFTYRIDPLDEIYAQTGEWTSIIDIGEPFPVKLPISRITPRHL